MGTFVTILDVIFSISWHLRSMEEFFIDLYIMLAKMGWVDTYLGILAPNCGSALAVFLIRQSMKSILFDLIEAARLDGAGEIRIALTIIAYCTFN